MGLMDGCVTLVIITTDGAYAVLIMDKISISVYYIEINYKLAQY